MIADYEKNSNSFNNAQEGGRKHKTDKNSVQPLNTI
jgi:hypothetical protein